LPKINPNIVKLASHILWQDEIVLGTATQHYTIIFPSSIIISNKRIIIINYADLGMHHDFEMISYSHIVSVRLEHGVILASIHVRMLGYESEERVEQQEGKIVGLKKAEAEEIVQIIDLKLRQLEDKIKIE
jgi:hypothetical protein